MLNTAPHRPDIAAIDPKAAEFMDDPWPFYRGIRDEGGVFRDPRYGIYFVGRYDLAQEVLKQPQLFSSAVDRKAMREGGWPAEAEAIRANALPRILTITQNDDQPTHDMFRGLVAPFFLPKNLGDIETFVRGRTEQLLDDIVAQGGRVDFLKAFAVPLPISVIGEYLGMAEYGYDTLKGWSDAFADELGLLASDERAIEIAHATVAWQKAVLEIAERRRADPRPGVIISHLANARVEDDRPLSDLELVSIMTQLLIAGNDTTTHTMAGGVRRMASDAALFSRLKAEPQLISGFVEETLRLESPVQGQFRRATADTELGGVAIPAGALLHIRLASANRDEGVYGEQSDAMILGARPPKPHMSFGMGLHFCVGAMLSRLELQIAFKRIVERFESLELDAAAPPLRYHTHFHLRGLTALPVVMR